MSDQYEIVLQLAARPSDLDALMTESLSTIPAELVESTILDIKRTTVAEDAVVGISGSVTVCYIPEGEEVGYFLRAIISDPYCCAAGLFLTMRNDDKRIGLGIPAINASDLETTVIDGRTDITRQSLAKALIKSGDEFFHECVGLNLISELTANVIKVEWLYTPQIGALREDLGFNHLGMGIWLTKDELHDVVEHLNNHPHKHPLVKFDITTLQTADFQTSKLSVQ